MADIVKHDVGPHQVPDGGYYAVVPEGGHFHDLEPLLPVPIVARAVVQARTVASLIAYTAAHKTAGTAVFADVETGKVQSVIDYIDAENLPAHKAQRCVYDAPFSEEWKRWTAVSGKQHNQEAFALFIEENRDDVVTPDGATMLELAKNLDAKKKVTFRSGLRLDDGSVDLSFTDETTAAGAGINGKIAIPTEIELGIPVFYGGDRYKVTAFFRYRIVEGKLVMWVDLHRMKHIRDAAFADIIETVAKGLDGVAVYEASLTS